MVIVTTILKIALIPCMLALILLMLMMMGIIPSERIIEFIKKYKVVEAIYAIMVGVGLLGSFLIILS